jgi:hypothetical protein
MVNQPEKDTQGVQTPSRKLVLPALSDEELYKQRVSSPLSGPPIDRQAASPSHNPFTRLFRLWQKDPAYVVLSLAIALVALASLVFVVLGANAILSSNSGPTWSSAQIEHPPAPTPAGTVDNSPTFPTPGSNKGSSSSSQPHGGPTPTLQPSPVGDQGTLNVQIVSIPDVVHNNTRVRVVVQTSEPGVSVRLQVTYDAAPFFYTNGAHTTDGNGNATLTWNVRVFGLNGNGVQATVVVIATDRQGQQATSQPSTVMVTG